MHAATYWRRWSESRRGEGSNAPNPIVEKTLAKLGKARPNTAGLVVSGGAALVNMAVRPETLERAGQILTKLVAAGEAAGLKLVKAGQGAAWLCDGQAVSFELIEVADQVEHVATAKELAAVEKWKRDRDDYHDAMAIGATGANPGSPSGSSVTRAGSKFG